MGSHGHCAKPEAGLENSRLRWKIRCGSLILESRPRVFHSGWAAGLFSAFGSTAVLFSILFPKSRLREDIHQLAGLYFFLYFLGHFHHVGFHGR